MMAGSPSRPPGSLLEARACLAHVAGLVLAQRRYDALPLAAVIAPCDRHWPKMNRVRHELAGLLGRRRPHGSEGRPHLSQLFIQARASGLCARVI